MKKPKFSVVIPCFNEEEVIEKTCKRVISVMEENNLLPFEMVLVNDGSTDKTLEILEKMAETDKRLKIVSFSRNFGHEAATTAGLHNAKGDYVFIIDADLQDPPELFPEMYGKLIEENADAVYGVRKKREGETFLKKLTSKIFYRFYNAISETKFPEDTGDFRLINRKIAERFRSFPEKNKYVRGLLSWVGFKQVPFYYLRAPRQGGKTKYNYSKLLKLAINIILSFTKKPLEMVFFLGLFCLFFSFVLFIYVLISKVVAPLKGWASIVSIIVFFGGIQLLSIGVIAQYIGYIFDEVKNRPEYIVEKKINFD